MSTDPQQATSWLHRWWGLIPESVRKYLVQLVLFFIAAIAAMIAARYGLPTPPAGPVVVEQTDRAQIETQAQTEGEVPPDVLNFCGFRANLLERLTARPWPNREIKWHVDTSGYSGRVLTREQITEAFDVAWKSWARDLDIEPVFVTDPSEANVRSKFGTVFNDYGRPDGPGNILAWSELSDGSGRPRQQMYDRAEPWTISSNPGQAVIDVVRVAAHEIGHAMGLVHDSPGAPTLMAPMYSRSIQFPQRGDIERAIRLGYPPRTTGGMTPAPTITIEFAVDPEKLAELLRKNGYKAEIIKR